MKIISRIYRKAIVATVLAFALLAGSCTDYLTIIPPNKVVEENFWQTKDHVNGMLATSYLRLLETSALKRMALWGEVRSDNMTYHSSTPGEIKDLIDAKITDENSYCQWNVFYEAISNANLVLENAAQVVDRDPDFSEGELEFVKGEMYAIRALCHFYLVRTFRDIPLALKSAKNDSEIPEYEQVSPLVALDSIMADLDRAEDMVRPSGAYPSPEQNCGRITRNAVLAMKADVNLWRAAFATYYNAGNVDAYYDECIEDCNEIIENMDKEFEDDPKNKNSESVRPHLIQNDGKAEEKKASRTSSAYDDIFGAKNSMESIFELQVQGDNATDAGFAKGISDLYGAENGYGNVVVPKKNFYAQDDARNYKSDDLRAYSNTKIEKDFSNASGTDEIQIVKYSSKSSPASDFRKSDSYDANWIVYRKTDVMLMKAEALVSRSTSAEKDFRDAFSIVKTINYRSRMDTTDVVQPLKVTNYLTQEKAIELVRTERRLELAFEGKRWYDLVRQALIEKDTKNITYVANKLESSSIVKTKMSTIDALFLPIHINELRYNKKLKQNPAYEEENESSEMN